MKNQADSIFEDIISNHKDALIEYEAIMQIYYREMMLGNYSDPIPRAKVKALVALLEHCGYRIVKRPKIIIDDTQVVNVIKLRE